MKDETLLENLKNNQQNVTNDNRKCNTEKCKFWKLKCGPSEFNAKCINIGALPTPYVYCTRITTSSMINLGE